MLIGILTSGCTLQFAHNRFTAPILDAGAASWALEGAAYPLNETVLGQRVDLGLAGAYQGFDFFTDAAATHVEGRIRLFPVDAGFFDPFLGGGIGIYSLRRTERNPLCRGSRICLGDQREQRGQATGLTPHLTLGSTIGPRSAPAGLILSVTREFGVFDPAWDLSAWRLSAGISWDPR